MADDNRNDKAGKLAADERFSLVDKTSDDELSDAELAEADGGRMAFSKKPDEDAGPDGRLSAY